MISVEELKVLPFGSHTASYNMALDSRLLDICARDPRNGFLRFYQWAPPALSLGFFEPADTVDWDRAAERGVDVVRRPTGGRVVLHKGDLTYSVAVPRQAGPGSAVYARISECIAAGLRSLGAGVEIARGARPGSVGTAKPCFLSASRHEIVYRGRKVVGSAQRVGRNALLQHGSIPLDAGFLEVVDYMKCSEDGKARLKRDMITAAACVDEILGVRVEPAAVAVGLLEAFRDGFGPRLTRVSPDYHFALDQGGSAGLTP